MSAKDLGGVDLERPVPNLKMQAGPKVQYLLVFWIIGTALLGKSFSYLHVGPIYITELVLGLLVLSNLARFQWFDFGFVGLIVFYVLGGILKQYPIFFVGKDIAIVYYLLFLRFFPTNLNPKFKKPILYALGIGLFLGLTRLVPEEKYKFGILLIFWGTFLQLRYPKMKSLTLFMFYFVGGVLINFKTIIILAAFAPITQQFVSGRIYQPKKMVIGAIVFLALIFGMTTDTYLNSTIDLANFVVQIFGLNINFSTNTASWRADIWRHALAHLRNDNLLLFGTFPGFNFMDSGYLGGSINLLGGDSLGVVRTAHNAVVQIVMKSGILGLISFFLYFSVALPKALNRQNAMFVFMVFICALSSDILEVPSRGPLFYALIPLLHLWSRELVPLSPAPGAVRRFSPRKLSF